MIKCCFGCLDDACIPKLDTKGECWQPWDSGLIHSTIWKVTLGYITHKDSEVRWNSRKIKHLKHCIFLRTWIPTFFPGTLIYPLAKLDTYTHRTVWFLQVLPTALSCCLIGYMESIVWAPSWVRYELSSDGPPLCRVCKNSQWVNHFRPVLYMKYNTMLWWLKDCGHRWIGAGLPKTGSPWLKFFPLALPATGPAFVVYPGGRQA